MEGMSSHHNSICVSSKRFIRYVVGLRDSFPADILTSPDATPRDYILRRKLSKFEHSGFAVPDYPSDSVVDEIFHNSRVDLYILGGFITNTRDEVHTSDIS